MSCSDDTDTAPKAMAVAGLHGRWSQWWDAVLATQNHSSSARLPGSETVGCLFCTSLAKFCLLRRPSGEGTSEERQNPVQKIYMLWDGCL